MLDIFMVYEVLLWWTCRTAGWGFYWDPLKIEYLLEFLGYPVRSFILYGAIPVPSERHQLQGYSTSCNTSQKCTTPVTMVHDPLPLYGTFRCWGPKKIVMHVCARSWFICLQHWIPWINFNIVTFENNKLCLLNVFFAENDFTICPGELLKLEIKKNIIFL